MRYVLYPWALGRKSAVVPSDTKAPCITDYWLKLKDCDMYMHSSVCIG